MKKTILFLSTVALISCAGKENHSEDQIHQEEIVKIVNTDTVLNQESNTNTSDKVTQPSIVTQEHWDSFDTQIKALIYFTKKDSTFTEDQSIIDEIKADLHGVENYKMYTNDNYAQLYLNDTLAFDISPFLLEHENGFVLLKPHTLPTYQSIDANNKITIDNVITFFKN